MTGLCYTAVLTAWYLTDHYLKLGTGMDQRCAHAVDPRCESGTYTYTYTYTR